jgi:hypothetical protein
MEGAGGGHAEAAAAVVVTARVVASRLTRTCLYLASLTQKDGILLRLKFRVWSLLLSNCRTLLIRAHSHHQLIELGR